MLGLYAVTVCFAGDCVLADPGARPPSAATLGRKGWAFAFLAQGWADTAAALEKVRCESPCKK